MLLQKRSCFYKFERLKIGEFVKKERLIKGNLHTDIKAVGETHMCAFIINTITVIVLNLHSDLENFFSSCIQIRGCLTFYSYITASLPPLKSGPI